MQTRVEGQEEDSHEKNGHGHAKTKIYSKHWEKKENKHTSNSTPTLFTVSMQSVTMKNTTRRVHVRLIYTADWARSQRVCVATSDREYLMFYFICLFICRGRGGGSIYLSEQGGKEKGNDRKTS